MTTTRTRKEIEAEASDLLDDNSTASHHNHQVVRRNNRRLAELRIEWKAATR